MTVTLALNFDDPVSHSKCDGSGQRPSSRTTMTKDVDERLSEATATGQVDEEVDALVGVEHVEEDGEEETVECYFVWIVRFLVPLPHDAYNSSR